MKSVRRRHPELAPASPHKLRHTGATLAKQAGVSLDHYSGSQAGSGAVIPVSSAQPGDILWKSGHVGIYIGNGQYIHAPQTGDVVKIASNVGRFTCAVRPY